MNSIDTHLLREIADLERVPQGAYNIRKNGQLEGRSNSANIVIESKEDKPGIDIHIAPGTVNESVHIPVIVTQTGLTDLVYNDFHIGENSDVSIVAGCGIHNSGCETAQHDGVHTFYVGKNAKVRYVEKHYGEGEGTGKRILNPVIRSPQQEAQLLGQITAEQIIQAAKRIQLQLCYTLTGLEKEEG